MNKKTIVIVDDEIDIITLMLEAFEERGFEVIDSSDPLWVLDNVDFSKVDCILTDILMPELDGVNLIRKIQAKGFNPKVFFMTGYSDYSREELNELKPKAIIFKPFDVDEAADLITAQLK